jgi:uncharacterized cupin superfamily protein
VNLNEPDFDEAREVEGFRARRARIGRQLGSEQLGISYWELPAGQAAYPYHWHVTEEELLVVMKGAPSLRTPEGWRELEEGEVVAFPRSEEGGHQLVNRTDDMVRFLAFSTPTGPGIVMYPDSGKVGADGHRFRLSDEVDYYDGETPPE